MTFKSWEGKQFRKKFEEIKFLNEKWNDGNWRSDPYASMYYLLIEIERCLKKDYENNCCQHDEEF